MSNDVYPALPGAELRVTRTPLWQTDRRGTPSGRSFRSTQMTAPNYRLRLRYEFLRDSVAEPEYRTLLGFFNKHLGGFDSFRFDDIDDNTATAQAFGVGDGSSTAWQLVRTLGGFVEPVYELNGEPVITYNGQNANLVPNSSFEAQPGGRPTGYDAYLGEAVSTSFTAPAGRTGGLAYGLKANGATALAFGLSGGFFAAGGVSTLWKPGVTYTLSFYARKLNGAGWAGMGLGWNTPPSSQVWAANPALSGSWQRYIVTLVWGGSVESGGNLFISVAGSTAINDEIQIDDLQVVLGDTAPAYVAGDQRYTVNATAGVTFSAAPPSLAALAWSGKFFWRCVFESDELDFEKFLLGFWEAKGVALLTDKP